MMGLDIGPETAKLYAEAIASAQTRVLERPHGRVRDATRSRPVRRRLPQAVAANKEADTVIGGGDSVAAVNKFDLADQMTFISTGGGASYGARAGRSASRRRGAALNWRYAKRGGGKARDVRFRLPVLFRGKDKPWQENL